MRFYNRQETRRNPGQPFTKSSREFSSKRLSKKKRAKSLHSRFLHNTFHGPFNYCSFVCELIIRHSHYLKMIKKLRISLTSPWPPPTIRWQSPVRPWLLSIVSRPSSDARNDESPEVLNVIPPKYSFVNAFRVVSRNQQLQFCNCWCSNHGKQRSSFCVFYVEYWEVVLMEETLSELYLIPDRSGSSVHIRSIRVKGRCTFLARHCLRALIWVLINAVP